MEKKIRNVFHNSLFTIPMCCIYFFFVGGQPDVNSSKVPANRKFTKEIGVCLFYGPSFARFAVTQMFSGGTTSIPLFGFHAVLFL